MAIALLVRDLIELLEHIDPDARVVVFQDRRRDDGAWEEFQAVVDDVHEVVIEGDSWNWNHDDSIKPAISRGLFKIGERTCILRLTEARYGMNLATQAFVLYGNPGQSNWEATNGEMSVSYLEEHFWNCHSADAGFRVFSNCVVPFKDVGL